MNIFENGTVYEACAGVGMQMRGLDNAIKEIGLQPMTCVGISEVAPKAIIGYAVIHFGLTKEMAMDMTKDISAETMARELTDKGIGQFEGTPNRPKPIDWMKKLKGKGLEYLRLVYAADKICHNDGDMTKVKKLPEGLTVFFTSTPCFTGDTLVLTKDGYKQIKDVVPGDEVLTHDGTYNKVLNQMMTGTKNIYHINAAGFDGIDTTENHKFYARKKYSIYRVNGRKVQQRRFKEPEWVEAKDLDKTYYLGCAINQNSIVPTWNGSDIGVNGSNSTKHVNELSKFMDNEDFWWIIGRYLGDGWYRLDDKHKQIIICTPENHQKEIEERYQRLGFNYCICKEKTNNKIVVNSVEFCEFVKAFGKGAGGKFIPGFVFDMPNNLIESLLKGYISADGTYYDNFYSINSISKELLYGTAHLVAKVWHRPYSIYLVRTPDTCVIDGRTVNQKDYYHLQWKMYNLKNDRAFYENGYIWYPIYSVDNTHTNKPVYDITVDNNHSFIANGCIVHNCQSASVAGLNAGFVKDSGTRSAIAWDVPRLIKSTSDKPKILIFENVKGMLSKGKVKGNGKNNFETFLEIVDEVEALGYNAYYKILNAKYCGVPQNRERVFFVAIRKDVDTKKFEFPKPFDCGVRLKDILQDKVDDIYYINSEKATNLIQQLYDKGELKEDVNPCDGTINNPHVKGISNCIKSRYDMGISNLGSDGTMVVEKIPYILTDKGADFAHKADVACTLKARDWKGLDNKGSNGVVERTMSVNKLGNIYGGNKGGCFAGNVYDSNAISPALTTMEGGNRQPMVVVMYRVRKLTPEECFVLMGLEMDDCTKCREIGLVNTDLYKIAGNGLVTNCISLIIEHLYKANVDESYICEDELYETV